MYCMMRFIILFTSVAITCPVFAQASRREQPAVSPASAIKQFYQKKVKAAYKNKNTFQARYNATAFAQYPRVFWEDVVPGVAGFEAKGNFFMFNLLGTYDFLKTQKAMNVESLANQMAAKIVRNPRRVNVARELPLPQKGSPWAKSFQLSSYYIQLGDYAAKVQDIKKTCAQLNKYASLPQKERDFMMKGYEDFDCSVANEKVDPQVFSKRQEEIARFVRAYTRISNGFIRSTLVPLQTNYIPGADVKKYVNSHFSLRNAPKGLTAQAVKDSLLKEIKPASYYYEQAEKMNPGIKSQLAAAWQTVSFQGSMDSAFTALSILEYLSPGTAMSKIQEFGKLPSHAQANEVVAGRLAAAALNKSIAQIANDLFEFEKPFYYSYVSMRGAEKEIGKNWYAIALNSSYSGYMVAQRAADNLLQSGHREYQTKQLSAVLSNRRITKNVEFYKKTVPFAADMLSGGVTADLLTPLLNSKRLGQWLTKWNLKKGIKTVGRGSSSGGGKSAAAVRMSKKTLVTGKNAKPLQTVSQSKAAASSGVNRAGSAAKTAPAAKTASAATSNTAGASAAAQTTNMQAGKTLSQLQEQMFPKPVGISYNKRSLTPSLSKGADKGPITYRADGLVYMEAHPTDPSKAVFYYADEMGKVNTAKEVPMSTYNGLMKQMNGSEKEMLGRIADSYQSEINALRAEREYDRLDDIAKEITRLRAERKEIANSRTYHLTEGSTFKRVNEVDKEIAALEREAQRTIKDMSRNGLGKEENLEVLFKLSQGTAEEGKAVVRGTLSYKNRSLMPATKEKVPEGVFDVREDGLVYMEADPTDANKTIYYYLDKDGQIVTREIPRKEYEVFVQGLKEEEKVVLQQSARAYQAELNALRAEREYDRLMNLGKQIEKQKKYSTYLQENWKGDAATRQKIQKIEEEIKSLNKEVERTINDMVNNNLGSRRGITEMFYNFQGSPVQAPAQRVRLVVSDDFDEAYKQVEQIGRRIESLEAQRAQITRTGEVTPRSLQQVRDIDEELRFLRQEESSGILQMEKKGMGNRRTLRQMIEDNKTNPNYSLRD